MVCVEHDGSQRRSGTKKELMFIDTSEGLISRRPFKVNRNFREELGVAFQSKNGSHLKKRKTKKLKILLYYLHPVLSTKSKRRRDEGGQVNTLVEGFSPAPVFFF